MYAVDNLGDAIDVARDFLTPVKAWIWLKLALVVFFVGSAGGGFPTTGPGSFQNGPSEEAPTDAPADAPMGELPTLDTEFLLLIAVIAVIGLSIWLAFATIGAIMEFVLVESLRSGEVHVRRFGGSHLGRAVRLLGFRIGLGLLSVALIATPFALIEFVGPGLTALGVGAWIGLGLYAVFFGLLYLVISKFTTEFVVPVMILEESGVLAAWGRFWPAMTDNKLEYVVYAILSAIVGAVLGFAIGIAGLILFLIMIIPAIIVGFILAMLGPVGLLIGIPLGILFVLFVIAMFLLLQVPIVTYLRYYALLVLGDTDGDLDPIPEQRLAVRAGDGGWEGRDPDADSDADSTQDGDGQWGSGWDEDDPDRADSDAGWNTGLDEDADRDESDDPNTDWDDADRDDEDGRW